QAGTDSELIRLGDRLLNRLDMYLGEIDEPAVLLHGDLWSGNAASDSDGNPVIFDPASYFGHREAEIGMMRMFGGFGPVCEAAYEEVWPFADGSEERINLYRLYHELNHLNLFGQGYYQSCLNTIQGLL
ncbi:MAG: fructosamine kinase family protein, partial [Gammaproteobacteria bacterium]|nr:fructosamine kinase family protein [Gammaproteobacteria bacterium]